jgi:hypothetical protein
MVNRVWRWHFGQGLVRSVDNFGRLGELPSHPELLDWLAGTFVADGWSLKQLHRRILLTETYQMSTASDDRGHLVDPENRLHWRHARQRMDAEVLRDALLAVTGSLDVMMGGAPMTSTPFQNLGLEGAARKPELYQSSRRSVYLPVLRSAVYDLFQAFDFPDPATLNGDRGTTTVAAQALFMLNSDLMANAAQRLATKLLERSDTSDAARLEQLSRTVFGRSPASEETTDWQSFLAAYENTDSVANETPEIRRRLAWEGLCRALLSSNEFVYVP